MLTTINLFDIDVLFIHLVFKAILSHFGGNIGLHMGHLWMQYRCVMRPMSSPIIQKNKACIFIKEMYYRSSESKLVHTYMRPLLSLQFVCIVFFGHGFEMDTFSKGSYIHGLLTLQHSPPPSHSSRQIGTC